MEELFSLNGIFLWKEMVMLWKNKLTELLLIEYPIIQAPMAGGPTNSHLVSAVSNAGGLGMIGAGYMDQRSLRLLIREVKEMTSKPFGVNLFVPQPYTIDIERIKRVNEFMEPFKQELSAETPLSLSNYEIDTEIFIGLVDVIISERVPICSFTFGIPSEDIISKLKEKSITMIGTATTVQEAIMNEKMGMDAVVVQGAEAGGHRGTFAGGSQESLLGLMSLLPQAVDQVKFPVIAAGGIMDGRGIMAAKCLGAQGCQLGTAFLVCDESGANPLHKQKIVQSTEEQAVLTKAFSGKTARGIQNRFIEEMKKVEEELPDYPLQNELTKGIRKAASLSKNTGFMSLWSGQSPRLAKRQTVQELMHDLVKEAEKIWAMR